jgi:hypothetical protein
MAELEPSRREFVRRSIVAGAIGVAPLLAGAAVPAEGRPSARATSATLPRLLRPHDSGARAEVLLLGARVVSWKRATGREMLFGDEEYEPAPGIAFRIGQVGATCRP